MIYTQLIPRVTASDRMAELDALIRQKANTPKMNPAEVAENQRAAKRNWRTNNPERQLALQQQWHRKHRKARLKTMRDNYWANREQRIQAMRAYRKMAVNRKRRWEKQADGTWLKVKEASR